MRILVTGAAGFIAGATGQRLIRAGHSLSGLDLRPIPAHSPLAEADIPMAIGDIRDGSVVDGACRGVEAIVHLAAATGVILSVRAPAETHDINSNGTFMLLDTARRHDIQSFVFASTGGAIAGDQAPPVGEDVVPAPLSPYGASKLYGEALVSAYAASYGMRAVALRFSNVYGPASVEKGSLVAQVFRAVLKEHPLQVYGDGTATRDFVHTNDIAAGIEGALGLGQPGQVYVLGTGLETSVNELLTMVALVTGTPVEVQTCEKRSGEIYRTYSDIRKARGHLGYSPSVSLSHGLESTWSWFRDFYQRR